MDKLRWREPLDFTFALEKQQGRKFDIVPYLIGLAIVVLMLGGMWWHQNPIADSWVATISVAIATGFAVAFGIPMLAKLDPPIIFVGPKGIGRQRNSGGGVNQQVWLWEGIQYCQIQEMEISSQTFKVLIAYTTEVEQGVFPLTEEVDPHDLERVLKTYNCELRK